MQLAKKRRRFVAKPAFKEMQYRSRLRNAASGHEPQRRRARVPREVQIGAVRDAAVRFLEFGQRQTARS